MTHCIFLVLPSFLRLLFKSSIAMSLYKVLQLQSVQRYAARTTLYQNIQTCPVKVYPTKKVTHTIKSSDLELAFCCSNAKQRTRRFR